MPAHPQSSHKTETPGPANHRKELVRLIANKELSDGPEKLPSPVTPAPGTRPSTAGEKGRKR